MGSPLTTVRERERRIRVATTTRAEREKGEGEKGDRAEGAGDIYREIKKSREKLSVTGARPCPGLNST